LELVDWAQISGTRWYQPAKARSAAEALATAPSAGQAAQAVVDLRHAVSNDHRGSLCTYAAFMTGSLAAVYGPTEAIPVSDHRRNGSGRMA
jgi:hypothetical protein